MKGADWMFQGRTLLRALVVLAACGWAGMAAAQVCAAPGKDAPATAAGVVNTYYAGTNNRGIGATTVNVGAASGAAGTVTVGDLLLVIQMQGATINTSNNERYGDNVGANATPDSSLSQANGYTAPEPTWATTSSFASPWPRTMRRSPSRPR
jgi:hypothetical protein